MRKDFPDFYLILDKQFIFILSSFLGTKRSRTGIIVQSYYFSNMKANWKDAENYCVNKLGGHLTSIQNAEENKFINEKMNER